MKKVSTLLVILSITLIQSVRADEASHRKLAEELLTLMDVPRNMEQMVESFKKMQMTQLKNVDIPQEALDQVKSMQNKMMDLMAQEMSWDKLKQDYVSVYADTLTEQELRGIIRFYKSSVGQRFLKKTPEMMKRVMELSQKQMAKVMPKVQELMKTMMEELKTIEKDKPQEK